MKGLQLDANAFDYTKYKISSIDTKLIEAVTNSWKRVPVMSAVADKSWRFYGRMDNLPLTDYFGRLCFNVKEKVKTSLETEDLQERALLLVEPIGLLICEWVDLNRKVDRFDITEFLDSMVFESPHAIDYVGSINLWVQNCDDEIRSISLFSQACYYCIETKVSQIWRGLTARVKYAYVALPLATRNELFLHYWMYKLARKYFARSTPKLVSELEKYSRTHWKHWLVEHEEYCEENLNWLMLRFSVLVGNPSAVKYFYHILSEDEKAYHLSPCMRAAILFEQDNFSRDPKFMQIIQFLYAEMNSSCQLIFLEQYQAFFVSSVVKYWQCQRRAVHIIQTSWNIINDEFYTFLIKIISRRTAEGRYVQEQLIESIWDVTPESMKRKFFEFIPSCEYNLEIFSERVVTATEKIILDASTDMRNQILSFYEV